MLLGGFRCRGWLGVRGVSGDEAVCRAKAASKRDVQRFTPIVLI